ncbi:MAG: hypothetical protein ACK5MU_04655 [Candidatus Saccharimonadales bacterium]
MERTPNYESEKAPILEGKPPIEVFNDPAETEKIWGNPELTEQVRRRSELARNISEYFGDEDNEELEQKYFEAGAELLRDPEGRQVLLYLPLDNLESAPTDFREAYVDAWQELLFVKDMRENFNIGDVFEPEARPGDPERVVKCAHLLPWLVKAEYVSAENIADLVENSDDAVLKRSVLDTRELLEDWGLMSDGLSETFGRLEAELPPREKPQPLFISEARQHWLDHKDDPVVGVRKDATLTGPLTENLKYVEPEIAEIRSEVPEDALVFVGGSKLKGYGGDSSDLDVYIWGGDATQEFYDKYDVHRVPENLDGNPNLTNVVFDTVWLGNEEMCEKGREELVRPYLGAPDDQGRIRSIERIELDLLIYRLLHKGFARMVDDVSAETKQYEAIDGSSAFYDPRYRRVATELFAKYVFIPKLEG